MTTSHDFHVLDGDPHDDALVARTHPLERVNPPAADRYQLVVVGGGPAGLVAAFGAAGLGAKVAVIEKGLLGGDCLIAGCVPSKALLAAAHAAHVARSSAHLGVHTGEVQVDFPAIMERMRAIRADISHHDSVERLESAGIDVFLGAARFVGPQAVQVGERTLSFARAVVATGARAAVPPIPGIDEAEPLTNEGLFQLTSLPPRLVVLGAGPIGAEMAQAFARFGSEVTLVDMADRVLSREDPDASATVAAALEADGVTLRLGAQVTRMGRDGADRTVTVTREGEQEVLRADQILMALGRRPNVEGLDLDAAGVSTNRQGVVADDHLRTDNPRIYAAGDVAGGLQFTHAADAHARLVLQNAFFFDTKKVSSLVVPWATYTDPEVAHIGPPWSELEGRDDLTVFTVGMDETDRGRTDGTTVGFARVHADGKGRVVAGTVVGPGAGDVINELSVVMTNGVRLGGLAASIHAYPNRAEVLKKLGDAYNRSRFTPAKQRILKTWLSLRLR